MAKDFTTAVGAITNITSLIFSNQLTITEYTDFDRAILYNILKEIGLCVGYMDAGNFAD